MSVIMAKALQELIPTHIVLLFQRNGAFGLLLPWLEVGLLEEGLSVLLALLSNALSDLVKPGVVVVASKHLGLSVCESVSRLDLLYQLRIHRRLHPSCLDLGFCQPLLKAGIQTDGGLAPPRHHRRTLTRVLSVIINEHFYS